MFKLREAVFLKFLSYLISEGRFSDEIIIQTFRDTPDNKVRQWNERYRFIIFIANYDRKFRKGAALKL